MEYSNTLTKFGAAPADAEIRAILADVQARLHVRQNRSSISSGSWPRPFVFPGIIRT